MGIGDHDAAEIHALERIVVDWSAHAIDAVDARFDARVLFVEVQVRLAGRIEMKDVGAPVSRIAITCLPSIVTGTRIWVPPPWSSARWRPSRPVYHMPGAMIRRNQVELVVDEVEIGVIGREDLRRQRAV